MGLCNRRAVSVAKANPSRSFRSNPCSPDRLNSDPLLLSFPATGEEFVVAGTRNLPGENGFLTASRFTMTNGVSG
jgi:hypothetical protein